jgi:hypothetical protein
MFFIGGNNGVPFCWSFWYSGLGTQTPALHLDRVFLGLGLVLQQQILALAQQLRQ